MRGLVVPTPRATLATLTALALTAGGLALVAPADARAAAATAAAPVGAAAPVAVVVTSADASVEAQFVAKINASRAGAGLSAYVVRADLADVAQAQARRMAAQNRLYHNPNLATDVRNYRWAGENVGYGPGVDVLHQAFLNSPDHRANILDHDFTEVGLGAVWSSGRLWVAEVFREPIGGTQVRAATVRTTAAKARTAARPVHGAVARARPVLHYGMRNGWVRSVQHRLGVIHTGYFGPLTKAAVTRFQRTHRLHASGKVDLATWRAMGWPTTGIKKMR
jgi:uncharacterized protein YkwD